MGMFFYFDQREISLDDPIRHVKDEYLQVFGRQELRSYLLSELCALDMLYAMTTMKDGYYKERLVLKGGHSVRNLVPLEDHRFSFDADFNLNSPAGYTYGDIDNMKKDLHDFASRRGCITTLTVTKENPWYFLQVNYKDELQKVGLDLVEPPKIEICKTCRTHETPIISKMNTMINLEAMGLEPPELAHLSLEEQLENKLYVIGDSSRIRNHFDAYDAFRICNNNKIDWKKTKSLFEEAVKQSRKKPSDYVQECRRMLDTIKKHAGKRKRLADTVFHSDDFDFDDMIDTVKSYYDFKVQ